MWNPTGIVNLYSEVLRNKIIHNGVSQSDVQLGIQQIAVAYLPDPQILSSVDRRSVDYNKMANRCAYMHKFSAFYTGMVYEMFSHALRQSKDLNRILKSKIKFLKICCLGGGPGTDLIGVWSALHHWFGFLSGSATVVDNMSGWEDTIHAVIRELQRGDYGSLSQTLNQYNFDWSFLTADLLEEKDKSVKEAIGYADIITMTKFLSAAACSDIKAMVEEVFRTMKPGAVVFYIDNAAGGFRELLNSAARKCKMMTVFGPWCDGPYVNEAFNITRFDYTSCYATTVTVQILVKPFLPQH